MSSFKIWIVLALATLAACAEAGGEVRGGDLTQAGTVAVVSPVFVSPCKGPPPDGYKDVGDGAKWGDLYRDVFGPTNRPGSCSFGSDCHGTAGGAGAKTPGGLACFDQNNCYTSMTTIANSIGPYVKPGDPDTSSLLNSLLRRCRNPDLPKTATVDGGPNFTGYMPQDPSAFVYPQKSLDRIAQWIREGAQNN